MGNNPSIALTRGRHVNVHRPESILPREHLGNNGKNEFEYGADGRPQKRQIDVWQGAFKKSGMSAAQAKRLRGRLDKSLKNMRCRD